MKVKDLLYSTVGERSYTMLVDDHTMIVIDGFLEDRSIYGHWYQDVILDMGDQIVDFFSYNVADNTLHIIIKEDKEDELI